MGYVFISYNSSNKTEADAVRRYLSGTHIDCWMAPYDIPAGSKYAAEITHALRECSCLMLLLSNKSQSSEFVGKEVERAVYYKKPIVGLQLEDVILNDEFEYYLYNQPVVMVNRIDATDENFLRVIQAVKRYCGVTDSVKSSGENVPKPVNPYHVGDTIEFGHYPQGENGEVKPIEWIVLENRNGEVLLLSKYGLDNKKYNETYIDLTWETCTLRKWLNNDFINRAFTGEEQKRITLSHVTADENPDWDTNQGRDTQDKVFLLSIQEVDRYFSNNRSRATSGTPYCYKQGAYKVNNGNCWWWLRSAGDYSSSASYVYDDGRVDSFGDFVSCGDGAVRPALHIHL